MSNESLVSNEPQSREDRINRAIRDLGKQVRELRRELEEVLAGLKSSGSGGKLLPARPKA